MLMQRFGAVALSVILAITQVSCLTPPLAQQRLASSSKSNLTVPASAGQKPNLDLAALPDDTSPTDFAPDRKKNPLVESLPANVDVFAATETLNLVVIPDTQFYSQDHPDTFNAIANWIVGDWDRQNFDYVLHLGDIVNKPDREEQWKNAAYAMSILGDRPYVVLPGNHDYTYSVNGTHDYSLFNKYFPGSILKSTNKGNFPSGTLINSYIEVKGYLILNIGFFYNFDNSSREWIIKTLSENANLPTIVLTHDFLLSTGELSVPGRELWAVLNGFPNVFLILSGHAVVPNQLEKQEQVRLLSGRNGNTVHAIMSNYQDYLKNNSGYNRIYKITPGSIEAKTFSPMNGYLGDTSSRFILVR